MKNRLIFLSLFLLLMLAILPLRFFQIAILENDKWQKAADRQHLFIAKELPHRGTFYSNTDIRRNHLEKPQKLVQEVEKFHLFADPLSIPDAYKKKIFQKVGEILNLSKPDKQLLWRDLNKKSRSRRLFMWLDREDKKRLEDFWRPFAKKNKIPLNALFFTSDYKRSYPFGKMAGQILHTIQNLKDEKTFEALPTGGLELSCNHWLHGKIGKRRQMRSPRNELETGEIISLPENGADVYLTINHTLQLIAEEEVMAGVKRCGAKSGWAVMMCPYTGEIWACAQYPFFEPERYADYFKDPVLLDATRLKAATDAIEPGSAMKAVTGTIALIANEELKKKGEAPLFSTDEKIACSKGNFKGRRKPITDTHLHPFLNFDMAMQKSSNIYMATLVDRIIKRLGDAWYRDKLATLFSFGKKTGIEIPGETAGVLPKPGRLHQNGRPEWSVSTPHSLAMGYNLQCNTFQMMAAHARIINGGYAVTPTLIKKIVKGDQILYEKKNQETKPLFSKTIADQVKMSMKYATKTGGTSRRGDILGYSEGGKSSTTYKLKGSHYATDCYVSNFIGFAPAEKPIFILIVTMDEPTQKYVPGIGFNQQGGSACAPIFASIGTRALRYLGINPDDPHGYPRTDPRFDPEKADWYQETKKLEALYDAWNRHETKKAP